MPEHTFLIAASLAICAGFRAFVPLFIVSLLGRYEIIPSALFNPTVKTLLLDNEPMLYIVGALALIEILGDKSEVIGHFMDAVNLFLRPMAGGLLIFSFMKLEDPVLNYAAALVLGIILTIPFHSLKANARFLSQDSYFSAYNLYLSLAEDFEAILASFLSIFAPVVSILVTPILFLVTLKLFKNWKIHLVACKELNFQVNKEMTGDGELLEVTALKRMKKKRR